MMVTVRSPRQQQDSILFRYLYQHRVLHSIMSNGDSNGPETAGSSHSALRNIGEPRNESTSSTTQSTQSISRANSSIIPISNDRTDTSGENERLVLLKELESVVEAFRAKQISKTKAIEDVLRILRKNTPVSYSQSQKDATFDSYLTEILSIQSTFDKLGGNDETSEMPADLESRTKKRVTRQEDGNNSDSGDDDEKLLGLQTIQQYCRQSLVKALQVLVQMSLQECQLFRLVLS